MDLSLSKGEWHQHGKGDGVAQPGEGQSTELAKIEDIYFLANYSIEYPEEL